MASKNLHPRTVWIEFSERGFVRSFETNPDNERKQQLAEFIRADDAVELLAACEAAMEYIFFPHQSQYTQMKARDVAVEALRAAISKVKAATHATD